MFQRWNLRNFGDIKHGCASEFTIRFIAIWYWAQFIMDAHPPEGPVKDTLVNAEASQVVTIPKWMLRSCRRFWPMKTLKARCHVWEFDVAAQWEYTYGKSITDQLNSEIKGNAAVIKVELNVLETTRNEFYSQNFRLLELWKC